MKILFINSSARKQGNTQRILNLLQKNLQFMMKDSENLYIHDNIHIASQNVKICKGCRICFDKGEDKCPHQDDLLNILTQIHDSDVIVIGTPVYVDNVNGIMKNWIDRLAFICHRPELAEKMVYLISTVAGSPTFFSLYAMGSAFSTWGSHIIGKSGFKMGALMPIEE